MPAREKRWGQHPCCRASTPHSHPNGSSAHKAKHTSWQMPLKDAAGRVALGQAREAAFSAWPCRASPARPVSVVFLPLVLYTFFFFCCFCFFSSWILSFHSPASVMYSPFLSLWIFLIALPRHPESWQCIWDVSELAHGPPCDGSSPQEERRHLTLGSAAPTGVQVRTQACSSIFKL